MKKLEKFKKEVGRIIFSDVGNLIKEIKYGKPVYNLDIRPEITSTDLTEKNISYLYEVQELGYKTGYFGNHIVTDKRILRKGKKIGLPQKVAILDLGELGNSAGVRGLDIIAGGKYSGEHGFLVDYGPRRKVGESYASIHLEGHVHKLDRTKRGLRLN